MSHIIYGWPSWTREELATPGAGPSGTRSNNGEQELNAIRKGAHVARSRGRLHVPQNRAGYSQSSDARMCAWSRDAGSRFPVQSAYPAPSFIPPPITFPAPIPFALPTWASTSMPVTVPQRRTSYAPAPIHTPVLEIPTGPPRLAPEEIPSPVSPAAPPAPVPTTPIVSTAPPTPAAHALHDAPTSNAISMARLIPTDAQRSAYSALEGAMRPIKGPWVKMARTVTEARLDPEWDPSVFRRETRKRRVEAEEQPPLKRARVEEGLREVITEASVVGYTVDEIRNRMVKARAIGSGAMSDESEGTWPLRSGYRRIAPKPALGPVKAVGGLRPMPVVVPQVHGNALHTTNYTSTTSTHRVDNPAGEPVIEPVLLPSGGPSTSTHADDQDEAGEPDDYDHDEHQHQLGDEPSLSKREVAVVIDEKIFGGDLLRCLACNNMSFGRKCDRRRHVVTIHYLDKVPCDWCNMFFYARRDGVTRHKDENCPARDFEDRHTNPMRWFMAWLSGPSGWR